jgi:hypothetical protein
MDRFRLIKPAAHAIHLGKLERRVSVYKRYNGPKDGGAYETRGILGNETMAGKALSR